MASDDNEFVHMALGVAQRVVSAKAAKARRKKNRNPAAKDKSFQGNRGKIIRLFKDALKGLHLPRVFV
ncbi:hypothetical protein TH24_14940 [Thalassospira xiamenensis]|nr:hypothetical protein TH24_14940 [Thalassospira xiamenensis]